MNQDRADLRGFKELVELGIFACPRYESCRISTLEQLGIDALRASECHKDCKCKYECGCTETGDCQECNPPRMFLRIMDLYNTTWREPLEVVTGKGTHSSKMQVLPRRVISVI